MRSGGRSEIRTIIPAQPGWFVAEFIASNADNITDPIIAWSITDDEVRPVTCAGVVKGGIYVIKRPDGLMTIPGAHDESVREREQKDQHEMTMEGEIIAALESKNRTDLIRWFMDNLSTLSPVRVRRRLE
jgi:hypothetical protein